MDERSVFGRQLREARLRAGLSQKQLGIEAGIDEFSASPRINQYERGIHTPDYRTAKRLANSLKVPVEYLYSDSETMAEVILLAGSLNESERRKLLEKIKSPPQT